MVDWGGGGGMVKGKKTTIHALGTPRVALVNGCLPASQPGDAESAIFLPLNPNTASILKNTETKRN